MQFSSYHGRNVVCARSFLPLLLGLLVLFLLSCSEHDQMQMATEGIQKQNCSVESGDGCAQTKVLLDAFQLVIAGGDGNFDKLKALIDAGFDVNRAQESTGMTLLMYAVKKSRIQIVTYLLALPQIDKSIVDNDGHSALWHARQTEDAKLINDILGKTTSTQELNESLAEKIKDGDLQDIATLLDDGAEVEARFEREQKQLTPLLYSILLKKTKIVSYLIEHRGADILASYLEDGTDTGINALMMALDSQNPKIIDTVLAKSAMAQSKDSSGKTPLFYAAHLKDFNISQPIADSLLASGASLVASKNDGTHLLTYIYIDQSNIELGDYLYDICLTKHTQQDCDEE